MRQNILPWPLQSKSHVSPCCRAIWEVAEGDLIASVLLIYLLPASKQHLATFLDFFACFSLSLPAFLEQDTDWISVLHTAEGSAAILTRW